MHNCNNTSCCNCSQEDQYEELIPYKEYAIGEFFKVGNEVFKVVDDPNQTCDECDIEEKCDKCMQCSEQFIIYDTLENE